MKAYKFTFKDLTAEDLFSKYMMITEKKAYMSGMIRLIKIEEV